MISTVALKNVRKDIWQSFKSESAKHGLNMGAFFEHLVEEHLQTEKQHSPSWDSILKRKPLLIEEAREIKKHMKEFRKGFSFRT